jgi:hypothetical protein
MLPVISIPILLNFFRPSIIIWLRTAKRASTAVTFWARIRGHYRWLFAVFLSPSRQIPRQHLDQTKTSCFKFISHPTARRYVGYTNRRYERVQSFTYVPLGAPRPVYFVGHFTALATHDPVAYT